tara:strand:+ start:289 stop:558 length:270 start_codon:yes stop_codon:yes gene_type:complete
MITNKKYLLFSFIFIASLSLHSFADHHDHFNFEEASIAECQACEENVEIKITKKQNTGDLLKDSAKANLTSRFASFKSKSYLSRAPPLS